MQPDFLELGRRLYERRTEAVVVPFVERSLGVWRPDPNECHRNCDWWVLHNPDCKAIRGWLLFDFGGFLTFVRFNAHSVLQEAGGNLIDITPSQASQRYPFMQHPGEEAEFISLVDGLKLVRFDYPVT
jgi:hypothetical protein